MPTGMQKFSSQGPIPQQPQPYDLSDNAGSLTHCAPGDLQGWALLAGVCVAGGGGGGSSTEGEVDSVSWKVTSLWLEAWELGLHHLTGYELPLEVVS